LLDVAIDTGLLFEEITDLRPCHLNDRGSTPYLRVETVVVWPGEAASTTGDVVERKHYTKGVQDRKVDLGTRLRRAAQTHDTHRLGPQDLLFHAERLRAEHLTWRAARDTELAAAFEATWQARLAAGVLPSHVTSRRRLEGA
jgi:hypothetical protein